MLDIDAELLEYDEKPADTLIADARAFTQLQEAYLPENVREALLPVGARVRHTVMGEGSVLEINEKKRAYLVKFDTIPTPRTISFKAKMERVEQ